MKIERSGRIKADATVRLAQFRRIRCLLVLLPILVAMAGVFAESSTDQKSKRIGDSSLANIIVVTNTNDSGAGSLRDALAIASDGDTIDATGVFGTILLTSGQLQITHNVTISGPGANHLAVDGNGQSRVFYKSGWNSTVSGLTIRNGHVTNDFGGGIFNYGGALTLSNCTVIGNSAYYGGGISNYNSGDSGIATLTLTNSTLSGNSAYSGGGIFNSMFGGGAAVTISNSTISGNSADFGGGIKSGGGGPNGPSAFVTISNSTISGNSAGNGGGIYNSPSPRSRAEVGVNNSTISDNSTTGNGGGIYNHGFLELTSTILNAGSSGQNIFNDAGAVSSLGYNVSSDDGGGYLMATGDQINTDPMLGPLQDNGGPTFTHVLLPGSSAINAGDPGFSPPPFFDQRGPGFDRVVNGRVDIGSFEVQGPTPTPTATPCGDAWVERSPVPYNAGGIFAASDGTFVYAGGGADLAKNTFHKDLLKYDPVNDSWTTLAASPDYHYHSQAVYFGGKIYNIGGYDENLEVTNTTRIYDIDTNTWTTRAPMPQALAQMATALWNDVIYVAGGNIFGARVNTLYSYDIASDTWTTLEPMPQAVTLAGFGTINGKLYIAGGSGDAGYLNTLYIYNIETHTWTTGANLPQALARPGSCVLNSRLYLYGGRLPDLTPTIITQIYDPVTNTWDPNGPPLDVPLFSSYGTAFGNDSIVALGGLDTNFVGLIDNQQLINIPCPTPTPTPTATSTATVTPTATPTATATTTATATPSATATPTAAGRASPTPRPRPTPAPRA